MEKIGKKIKQEEKVYLSALEQEKLTELGKKQQLYKELSSQQGDLKNTLKIVDDQAIKLKIEILNASSEFQEKYGNFTVGENFEVIKTEQNEK